MKIRVFCTLYEISDTNGSRYHKEKKHFDFPSDVSIEAAYAEIWDRFGKLGRDNRPPCEGYPFERAPYKYAEIQGHQLVDPNRPKGEIETFRAYQADLLDPIALRDCLKDSPNIKRKRR
jgi:hypothetical protein